MTAVIIDDEVNCTEVLNILLSRHCPDIQVLAVFNQPNEALLYLAHTQPDLLFLDIEMPTMNGFDLLQKLDSIASHVVFTTAFHQYAIKAFKFNAIDYLLKPIDKTELIEACRKSENYINFNKSSIQSLKHLTTTSTPEQILLPIGNELIFIHVKDIICCEADGSYCIIHCLNQQKPYLLSKTLRDIEELINNPKFFRPHASWLVNQDYIAKIIRGDNTEIILRGDYAVPVARNRKQEVMDRLIK